MFSSNTKVTSFLSRTLSTVALGIALALPQVAAGQALDDGSKARVNLSSKLGMLSAKISGAGCRIKADIDSPLARRTLADARTEVDAILDGLEDGDRALGIPTPETRSRTLRALRIVRDEWSRMSSAIDGVINGGDVDASADKLRAVAASFADKAEILASEIQAYYTNPNELLFADAIAIQMAGRQRSLSQRIASQACAIHTADADTPVELISTMTLFEKTLGALRDGLPSVGVRPPPSEPVAAKINASWSDWETAKGAMAELQSNGSLSAQTVAAITGTTDQLLKDMNDLVILYILSTPGRDGAIRGLLTEMAEEELNLWVQDPALVAAVKEQNARHAGLDQAGIDALDTQWRAEAEAGSGPLVEDLMSRPVSLMLRDKQVATAGFINEIFVMDNLGLNVAQSAVTSDYWQGDEDKWQLSFGGAGGAGAVHIGEVEFDDSTGVFQSQVSIPVKDLDTGAVVGAITFGVNVQSLL